MKINQSIVTFQTKEWQEQLPLLPTQPSIGAVGVGSYVNYNGTYHKIGGDYVLEVALSATLVKRKSRFKSVQIVLTPQNSSADLSAIASRYNTSVQNNKLFIDVTEEVMASTETIVSFSLTGGSTAINFYKTGVFAPYAIAIPLATEHPQTDVSILDKVSGKVDLSSGKLVANIPLVSADSSLHGVGVGLVTSPIGTKLNLEETFDGDKYIPADGQEQAVYEQFFYLKDGKKVAIESNKVTINADGTYKTTILNEEYEVIREEFLSNGAKVATLPEKVKNCAFYETRSDELRQVQEKLSNYEHAISDFVVWHWTDTSPRETAIDFENIDVQDLSYFERIKNAVENGSKISSKGEFLQIETLRKQHLINMAEYDEPTDQDIIPTYQPNHLGTTFYNYAYYDEFSLRQMLADYSETLTLYFENYLQISKPFTYLNQLVDMSNTTILGIEDGDIFYHKNYVTPTNDNPYPSNNIFSPLYVSGRDIKKLLYARNACILQISNLTDRRNEQRGIYEDQKEYYENLGVNYLTQLETIFKEYYSLKNKETELIKNTPVSFISSGSMHKGYNQDGELILFFQSQECYVSVNRDKDGKILSLSDENGNAILFKYDLKDSLEFIHDVRGRIITISHPEDGKIEIVYPDGQVLTLTQTELTIGEDTEKVVSKVETLGITANVTYTDTGILSKITRIGANNTLIDEFSVDKTDNAISITDYDKSITKYTIEGEEITQKTVLINDVVTEMIKSSTYIADVGNFHVGKFLQTATKTSLYKSESEVTFAVDANGNPTDNYVKQEFDDFNKLIRKEEKAEGVTVTTDYTYDEDGLLIKETALYVKQEGEETLETYTTVTEYSYNPSKAVVKKVSYVLGEELTNGKSIEEWIYDQNGILLKSFTYNSLDSSSKFYTEHIYDGKTHLADLDQTGEHKTEIEYVDKSSLVKTQKLPNGSKFSYGYDCADRLTAITQSTEEGEENSTSRIYENGLLKKLVSGDNVVTYTYTDDRKLDSVYLNGVKLASNSYFINDDLSSIKEQITFTDDISIRKDKFGRTTQITNVYGSINYTYDEQGRLKTETVKEIADETDGSTITYEYDGNSNRIISITGGDHNETYEYDALGLLRRKVVPEYDYRFSYDTTSKKTLKQVESFDFYFNKNTDPLGRTTHREFALLSPNQVVLNEKITYLKRGDHATAIPSAIYHTSHYPNQYTVDCLKYKYDKVGNISEIHENGKLKARYSYDGVNRLIREDNSDFGKTYLFTYDNKGNILSKKIAPFTLSKTNEILSFEEEISYGYDGDRLLQYKDYNFYYGEHGETKVYKNVSLDGQDCILSSYNGNTFEYNAKYQRTYKNNTRFVYDYDGNLLKQGDWAFTYVEGDRVGFYIGTAGYIYRKNAQGDVIAILDNNGEVVVKYVYDAWGNHKAYCFDKDINDYVQIFDSLTGVVATGYEDNVGLINPFRYRGYYYDVETGFYYLQSRYYDPEVGRFISPDSVDYLDPDSINGLNLYAYCGNNPVMNVDPTGHWLLNLIVVALLVVAWKVASSYIDRDENIENNLFSSMEEAVIAWGDIYYNETINDHKERGALILSKKINGKKYYYLGKTRVGFESSCWNSFLLGYLFNSGKIEGFIHSHTAYPSNNGVWNPIDYGPSSTDSFLFNIIGINRQFIVNELGVLYEFFKDSSTENIYYY